MLIETNVSLVKDLAPIVGWAALPREECAQNNTTPRKWNPEHTPQAEGDGSNERTIRYRMRRDKACQWHLEAGSRGFLARFGIQSDFGGFLLRLEPMASAVTLWR